MLRSEAEPATTPLVEQARDGAGGEGLWHLYLSGGNGSTRERGRLGGDSRPKDRVGSRRIVQPGLLADCGEGNRPLRRRILGTENAHPPSRDRRLAPAGGLRVLTRGVHAAIGGRGDRPKVRWPCARRSAQLAGNPAGGGLAPALGTGFVIAGVPGEVNATAAWAGKSVPAQGRRAAMGDGPEGAVLVLGKRWSRFQERGQEPTQRHAGGIKAMLTRPRTRR